MSEHAKTHTLQLGTGAPAEVTDAELAQIKKVSGRAFDQYTVTAIVAQPAKPAAHLPASTEKAKSKD